MAPGSGSGQLDQILDSISALVSSVVLLKFQADIEQRLPHQRMRHAAPLRRVPTQALQSGTTGTRNQGANTFSTAPSPAFTTAPSQAHGMPTFQPALTLAPVQRTCNTMSGVAATATNPSVYRFLVIFTMIEDGANTTP